MLNNRPKKNHPKPNKKQPTKTPVDMRITTMKNLHTDHTDRHTYRQTYRSRRLVSVLFNVIKRSMITHLMPPNLSETNAPTRFMEILGSNFYLKP